MILTTRADTDKKRLLLLAVGVLLLVSSGMFGTMFYLQSNLNVPKSHPSVYGSDGQPHLTAEEHQAFIEKARVLREKWKVWASRHKEEIKQMMAAPPTDKKALMRAYNAIPAHPTQESAGLESGEFGTSPSRFTWNIVPKERKARPGLLNDPTAKRLFDSEADIAQQNLQNDFATHRDFSISQSVNIGADYYKIWVSGRITKETYGVGGKQGSSQELEPPYEFLR